MTSTNNKSRWQKMTDLALEQISRQFIADENPELDDDGQVEAFESWEYLTEAFDEIKKYINKEWN